MNETNCSRFDYKDWLLWAAGDLPWWKRQILERHSERCPICHRSRSQTETLFRQTRQTFHSITPTGSLRSRIWEESAARKRGPLLSLAPSRRSTIGAAIAICLTGGILLLVTGFPGRPTNAFARVEQAMADVRTANWTTRIETSYSPRAEKPYIDRSINWISFGPPRFATFSNAEDRREGPTRFKLISDGVHSLSVDRSGGRWNYLRNDFRIPITTSDGSLTTATSPVEALRRQVIFPRAVGPMQEESSSTQASEERITRDPWVSNQDTLNGTKVLRFSTRFTRTFTGPGKPETRTEDYTAWVDPTTYRFLRQETTIHSRFGDSRIIRENFRYNDAPPDGVFDVTPPPAGQPYFYCDVSRDGWILKRPPADEQEAIRSVVQKAIDRWNRRDGDGFTALWDFGYGDLQFRVNRPDLPVRNTAEKRKRQWTEQARQGKPYRTWEIQKIWTAESWGGVYVRKSDGDAFPPGNRPIEYTVTVTGYATLTPGGQPVHCDAVLRLVRRERTYRITDITMYKNRAVSAHFDPGPAR